jgi:glucuronokinase
MTMELIRKHACARAALVGNPSDGFHGKTISVSVPNFRAEVILYEWEDLEVIGSQDDQSRFRSLDELVQDVERHGYYGGIRLVKATVKKFADYCRAQGHRLHGRNFSIRYQSNIPRQVGLSGSSAIVVASLRCLTDFYRVAIPEEVQPSLALAVETDELRLPAGLQDRVIQVYEGLVYMDFSQEKMSEQCGYRRGAYERLDPGLLPPLFVAYGRGAGKPHQTGQDSLRARFDRGDAEVTGAMTALAGLTDQARQAILAGDALQLGGLMDENFNTRIRIMQIREDYNRMVECARGVGASANFAGSGGAVVGIYRDEAMFRALEAAMRSIDCQAVRVNVRI